MSTNNICLYGEIWNYPKIIIKIPTISVSMVHSLFHGEHGQLLTRKWTLVTQCRNFLCVHHFSRKKYSWVSWNIATSSVFQICCHQSNITVLINEQNRTQVPLKKYKIWALDELLQTEFTYFALKFPFSIAILKLIRVYRADLRVSVKHAQCL